jgi:hypothetical protein
MKKPKLIYYNDARHYLMYRYDPPLSRHVLRQPVDEILGTGVDTLFFGLASGATFLHDTQVGKPWGGGVTEHNHGIMWWRAAKNLESVLAAGMDPLQVVIDRAHEKNIQIVCSLRINDGGTGDGPNANRYMFSKLKEKHPEYMIGDDIDDPRKSTCLNFAIPEVREERLAIIEEVCERYGADGIEIDDYVRAFFKQSEIEKNTPLLTEFMGDVRALLNRIGEKRGEKLMLAARVHPREDANLSVGMDVRSWVKKGFVDLVVVNYGGFQFDQDTDHAWLADATQGTDTLIYSHLGRTPYDDRHHDPTMEMYRAAASNHLAAGSDGIYMSSLDWPHGEHDYLILRELSDPDIYSRKNKHYMKGQQESTPYALKRHLPIVLQEGVSATVPIKVSDDVDAARADGELERTTLSVRIVQTGLEDKLSFKFNDLALEVEPRNISSFYGGLVAYGIARAGFPDRINTHYWFEFDIPIDLVQQGENIVEVMPEFILAERVEDRVFLHAELLLDYKQPPCTVGGQM